jgi:GntR family transcriptional regulator, transcriptional repressor for pyruvate dehydrogenase complex
MIEGFKIKGPKSAIGREKGRPAAGIGKAAEADGARTLGGARKPRVFERICDDIRLRVAAGELRPGDKLPPERELSASFGVSRSAVREALRSLEIAGVVKLQKGVKGGAFVLRGDPDLITRSIRDMFYLGRISLDNLTEARVLILDLAVRLASERITPDAIEALERNIDLLANQRIEASARERIPTSLDFYRLIAEATGNQLLQVIIVSLSTIVLQLTQQYDTRPLPGLIAARRRLLGHIASGDGAVAAREVTTHLRRLHSHLAREIKRHKAEGGETDLTAALSPL